MQGLGGEVVEEITERLLTELASAIASGISGFLSQIKEDVTNYLDGFFGWIIDPMVRTPAPEGPSSAAPVDIAFESATNTPWNSLISGIYFDASLG